MNTALKNSCENLWNKLLSLVIVHAAWNNVEATSHKIWWPIQIPG